MKIFLILFFLSKFAYSKEYLSPIDLECGVFKITGILKSHNGMRDYIEIYSQSDRHYEIDLFNIPFATISSYSNEFVQIEVENLKKYTKKEDSVVFKKVHSPALSKQAYNQPVELLKLKKCTL
jgi:hypothetical protein